MNAGRAAERDVVEQGQQGECRFPGRGASFCGSERVEWEGGTGMKSLQNEEGERVHQ